jgi:hypothetical protein
MGNWHYRITVHTTEEILAGLSEEMPQVPQMIYCDDQGACYFDEGPNPLTAAIEHVLNEVGAEGWELVQVLFRPHQMIGFWKQPR